MREFVLENLVSIIFGITSTVLATSSLVFYLRIEKQKQRIEEVLEVGAITLFRSREGMTRALYEMYEQARRGDEIWGQCVGCRGYFATTKDTIFKAAGDGVRFRILLNARAPGKDELRAVLELIRGAEVLEAGDNRLSIQGLTRREVIIAFPSLAAHPAIRFRDPEMVRLIGNYFDERWAQAVAQAAAKSQTP
jgi:hypothetical protein